jgi:SAM-dependent methyltransferase
MSATHQEDRSALAAYEGFAETYDAFTHGVYQYERWTGRLLAQAQKCGLEGNRLLDVACGTGLSFLPMLERGWQVTGCDLSPAMIEVARAKVGDEVELQVADMRDLPLLGEFDLIWSLNDSLNYLLSVEEMRSALRSMARNLAPRGILLFDLNTLRTFRSFFSEDQTRETDGKRFVWTGQKDQETSPPSSIFEGRYEVEGEGGGHVHRQRHFAPSEVLASIEAAGLRCIAALGEREGELEDGLDESVHTTAAYLCAGAATRTA